MRPVGWDELVELCESEGCKFDRVRGDHYIMTRPGLTRPVVIPKKKGLKEDIVLGIGRTLGLDRRALESRLNRKGKPGKGASAEQ
jgi:predicted RNA binding protein YcfA (HicA-like mRNA interferase family)